MQLPLFTPEATWTPPALGSLPSWAGAKRIAIDTETRDDHLKELGIGVRRGGYMVGVSVAIEDGPAFYLPIRHEGGDNVDEEQALRYLRAQAKSYTGVVVGANLSYDLDYWWEEGIHFHPEASYRDIQIADPLIYELHQSYSLDNIAKRYGLQGKDETLLREAAATYGVSPKSEMWKLPARYVGPYAIGDVEQPLLTLRRQERLIDEKDLWSIWNLESEVLPVLVRMRRRGVRVDLEKVREIEEWTLMEEAKAIRLVKDETGYDIGVNNVWKAAALAPALEAIGIKLIKTSTGQPSIDKDLLRSINHPVAQGLAWARKVNKMRTTFAKSIHKYQVNGRIHCTFNQIARESETGDQRGVRYGRLSATDPNLQQQLNPKKDPELASEWRKVFLPEEGAEWACCDYSQQEPHWTTHYAALMRLSGAEAAAEEYHNNPDLDNHQFMADLTGLERTWAKQIFLGLCYGEGGAKLSRTLGLPTRWALSSGRGPARKIYYFETKSQAIEAKKELMDSGFLWEAAGEDGQMILDTFDGRAPYIRQLAKKVEQRVKQVGLIITGGGRHLHFPQRKDGSYDWSHKGLNRLIQGTSADQVKMALVEIDRAGHHMMLQVHDDVANSVADRAEAEAIGEIMSNIMPARVPFKVDVEIGPNWGELS